MGGFLTNGMNLATTFTGNERTPFDTQLGSGANPQVEAVSILKLATLMKFYGSTGDVTPVSGTRYFISAGLGSPPGSPTNIGSPQPPTAPPNTIVTGVDVLLGSVGGSNNLIVELHDSTGALVATSATAGVLAGTANTWQRIPFTVPYSAPAGTYYIAVQVNGFTMRLSAYNSPQSPHLTGSVAGTFGAGGPITPPTTYTAGVGPAVQIYT